MIGWLLLGLGGVLLALGCYLRLLLVGPHGQLWLWGLSGLPRVLLCALSGHRAGPVFNPMSADPRLDHMRDLRCRCCGSELERDHG